MARRDDEPFAIFRGDPFDRALTAAGYHGRRLWGSYARACFLMAITWLPLVMLSRWEGNLWGDAPPEAFWLDLASWAQFIGFIPFATFAERYIGGKMRDAMPLLADVSSKATVEELGASAVRWSRAWPPFLVCVAIGYLFSWLWAREEVANGVATWHTAVATNGDESFTYAGLWVTFVALPIFTFMWLRWVWKIAVWTRFLYQLSRRPLRLAAVHPDRTAGLGCLSDVQTSFSMILFGSGILVSMAMAYKLTWEGSTLGDGAVWVPSLVYILLAPTVFLAPLFLFTRELRAAKRAALTNLQTLTVEVAQTFQDHWFADPEATGRKLLTATQSSHLADVHAAYEAVRRMRVVPFDPRSVVELVTFSAAPFTPLIFIGELPDKVQELIELLS